MIKNYLSLLQKDGIDISSAYLYGSYAKKKFDKNSDIDICIISDKFKDSFSANLYLNKKTLQLDNKYKSYLSPVGFNKQSFESMIIPLTYEIKKTGKKIKI